MENAGNLVVFVGGVKGGTGKSFVSMLGLHAFISKGIIPTLVETDTSNPDVYKTYQKKENESDEKCKVLAYNIDDKDSWIMCMNQIYEIQEKHQGPVIINSAARDDKTLAENGATLNIFPNLKTLWVINKHKDSIEQLKLYIEIVKSPICVIKNGIHGEEYSFDIFNKFNEKYKLSNIYLPVLFQELTDRLYNNREPYHVAMEHLSIFGRALAPIDVAKLVDIFENALLYAYRPCDKGDNTVK